MLAFLQEVLGALRDDVLQSSMGTLRKGLLFIHRLYFHSTFDLYCLRHAQDLYLEL